MEDTFVDLKNQTSPYQKIYRNIVARGSGQIELQYNTVTLDDSTIGLFEAEAQEEHYFSYKTYYDTVHQNDFWRPSDDWEFAIKLSEDKRVEKRKAYTSFDLLGDFGGFNDAIYFLLSIPLGIYSSSMFSRHISNLFNVQENAKSQHIKNSDDQL